MANLHISEVVMRDGLQIAPVFMPTEAKIAMIDRLSSLGFQRLEITSFVSPTAVPMLRDAELVAAGIRRMPGVTYSALVATARGAARAFDARVDEIGLVVSASETHNRANVGRNIDRSLAEFREIAAHVKNRTIAVVGGIAMAFGCPFEGDITQERLFSLIERYLELGIHRIGLGDTTGMAYPTQVDSLCRILQIRYPSTTFSLHFHNTRGLGLANVLAGVGAGITRFDACLGGLGGCPFAPGASGNICTEDLVHMLELMGHDTGIDLDGLIDASAQLGQTLGQQLPGQVAQAGPRWRPRAVHPGNQVAH